MFEERILIELSGENYALGAGEVAALCELIGAPLPKQIEQDAMLATVTESNANIFHERMGLAHGTMRLLSDTLHGEEENILEQIAHEVSSLVKGKTFSVVEHRLHECSSAIKIGQLKKRLGSKITEGKVDLDNPDIIISIWHGKRSYFGIRIGNVQRRKAHDRKVDRRPFFSPISIHPKLARTMINLARLGEGETLYDPFCGTGGILIEASMLGMMAKGSDIREDMVEGSRQNLAHFDLEGEVFVHDVNIPLDDLKVHAIVTDPPYGRASKMVGAKMNGLVSSCFSRASEMLKKGGYLVVVLPDSAIIPDNMTGFKLTERYELHVHGSLTRNFCVYVKEI